MDELCALCTEINAGLQLQNFDSEYIDSLFVKGLGVFDRLVVSDFEPHLNFFETTFGGSDVANLDDLECFSCFDGPDDAKVEDASDQFPDSGELELLEVGKG